MDPIKQAALDAVKDKDNRGYDVNGVRCHTAAEVHAAWKLTDDESADVTPAKPKAAKPKSDILAKDEPEPVKEQSQ